jgi:FlaA1/EpsC-like NDP-sugar epimerase
VLQAACYAKGGEIFVLDMGEPVRIDDMARKLIRLSGYEPDVDIAVTYTGLRPGEKLYEELLNQKELTLPTSNSKIMIARVREFDYNEVSQLIDLLIETSHQNKSFTTVKMMKQLVPEYISKNSIYEQLDPK